MNEQAHPAPGNQAAQANAVTSGTGSRSSGKNKQHDKNGGGGSKHQATSQPQASQAARKVPAEPAGVATEEHPGAQISAANVNDEDSFDDQHTSSESDDDDALSDVDDQSQPPGQSAVQSLVATSSGRSAHKIVKEQKPAPSSGSQRHLIPQQKQLVAPSHPTHPAMHHPHRNSVAVPQGHARDQAAMLMQPNALA